MTLRTEELRKYHRPMLRRSTFRFNYLRRYGGLIEEPTLNALSLGRCFGDRQKGHITFMSRLEGVEPELKRAMMDELTNHNGNHAEMIKAMQRHFIEHGVFADFHRPRSTGIILTKEDVGTMPVFMVLGESAAKTLHGGRLTLDSPSSVDSIVVFVTAAIARVAYDLQNMLEPYNKVTDISQRIARSDDDSIEKWCETMSKKIVYKPGETPVMSLLWTIATKALFRRYEAIRKTSKSPQEFLSRSLEMYLQSEKLHETAHLIRRKTLDINLNREEEELFAYLVQASYGPSSIAFLNFLTRTQGHAPLKNLFVGLHKDLVKKGVMVFCENEDYLSHWALRMLDNFTKRFTGQPHEAVIDPGMLMAIATDPILSDDHLPFVERAMHTPTGVVPIH